MKMIETVSWAAAALLAIGSLGACDRGEQGRQSAGGEQGEQYAEAGSESKKKMDRAGAAMDDAAISTKVRAAIVAERDLSVFKIDVDTKQGVVMLTGNVDSEAQRTRAEEVARGIQGVQSVDNQLTVSTG